MKILQVTNFFKPSWESGGPARVSYEISKNLVQRGHDVTVYTTDGFNSRLSVEKNKPIDVDGIKTYYFRNLSSYLARKVVFPIPYYLPLVVRNEINNFDIIHIHEHRTMLAAIVHHYAKKNGIPYILQSHGSVFPLFQKQILKKTCGHLLGYDVLRCASRVIALNNCEADQYRAMGIEDGRIRLLPNGIDISNYANLPSRGIFFKKNNIDTSKRLILYLGRLNKTKGIDLLINAFSDLSNKFDKAFLVLVGPDDGYRSKLEELINISNLGDKVLLTGFISSEEKLMAFVDSDFFVTPSFSGFPMTFLESLACGTPIITTNIGDTLEWINNNVGYVVKYDRNQLADAMFRILSDESLRARFGDMGKQLAKDEFNWPLIIEKLEKIYYEIQNE